MYSPFDWTTGDVITANRLDNLETQFQEAMQETILQPSISAGVLTLNLALSNVFDVALNQNVTSIVVSNISLAGRVCQFTLIFNGDGTQRTITFPAAWKLSSGITYTPTATSGKRDIITGFTYDGGVSFLIFISGQNH